MRGGHYNDVQILSLFCSQWWEDARIVRVMWKLDVIWRVGFLGCDWVSPIKSLKTLCGRDIEVA